MFKERMDYAAAAPDAMKTMYAMGRYITNSGLEHSLLELVKIRASQLNGCAYCIDMHTKDARIAGETEQRIYGLSAWRETPFYSDRERAALEWTESLTLIANNHVPDEVFNAVRPHFSDKEMADLTLAIVQINGWNRFAIGFRDLPGSYVPKAQVAAAAGD